MEKNFDEVIADMLIQLDSIERRMSEADERNRAFDTKMQLTIKRMVKAESRLEAQERRMEAFDKRVETQERRMEAFDKKLEQSIKNQKEFSEVQSQMNKYFLDCIKNNPQKR